jgi:malate synthase
MVSGTIPGELKVIAPRVPGSNAVLTGPALDFIARLQRTFGPERERLLGRRQERQRALDRGAVPTFLPETAAVRSGDWRVADLPAPLLERKVEITGPTDRKMIINALNSGANVFMADLEDANTPTWGNVVGGQANLIEAVQGSISLDEPDGRQRRLNDHPALLLVRPRGWHLPEKHVLLDEQPISGSLFDFGLYAFHYARLAREGAAKQPGPYYYLPKLESHLEARLWDQVFTFAEDELELARGTIRATVLIETVLAAFEMEEILYELRAHMAGLNAGRWDYIFSVIKKLHAQHEDVLPDRTAITMTVPFMRAYTELLVKTCHRRGAMAIGGMSAFIPNRRDPAVNEVALANVRADKLREVNDGFDGTWVAHPDLVSVAREAFDATLGSRPNQRERLRDDVAVQGPELLDLRIADGEVTSAGLERNVSIGIQYMASWLRGTGAVALYNLMEDAATAEISRSQVWQWVHAGAQLASGERVTPDLVRRAIAGELERLQAETGPEAFASGRYEQAAQLFAEVALSDAFIDFLTIPAYQQLD